MSQQPPAAADEIVFMSATELLDAYRRRQLSPVEVTRAVLDRIEATDPDVNAFCLVDGERALADARAAEARWQRGEPCGLLDGVPASVKDLLLTSGWPTLRGSLAIDPGQDWSEDAPCVARMREHGAVLVGKTTTPELGWKGVTDSPRTGITRNPWDLARTPGGSSGGSAVAVALGMAPLSVGTDGGGSIRIPAGFTGVFGLKPTYGRVPLYPASPFGTLSHAGPMTRTVQDAALLLDVISGRDPRDWSALPPPAELFADRLDGGVAGLRVAFSPTLGYVTVDPQVAACVRSVAEALDGLGAHVEEVDPGFDDPLEAFNILWFSGAAKAVAAFPPEQRTRMDPGLLRVAERGERVPVMDYLEATNVRALLGARMGQFHERFDLLVTPTLPIPAFAAGQETPDSEPESRWVSWTPFSYPFNLTQQPAASVPCGFTPGGLPIGAQLVAARHADATVLTAAKALQDADPWPGSPGGAPLRQVSRQ